MSIVYALWSVIINLDLIVIALLVLGTLRRWCNQTCSLQKPVTGIAAILLVFMLGDFPFSGRYILRHLEARFPTIEVPHNTHGMVITGGSLCLFETEVKGSAVYHKTAGRLFDALKVAHAHPHMEIVFAGSKLESDEFLKLATSLGVLPHRIKVVSDERLHSLEDAAAEASKLIGDTEQKKWILVTSAYLMPRTLNIFQSNRCNLTPFPVDYHTIGHPHDKKSASFLTRLAMSFQDRLGLIAWNIAWREIAGLCNLRLSGKTKTLFPTVDAAKT
jgi:uncharacterized SAM-binding protein YcdF (DUF218 family)